MKLEVSLSKKAERRLFELAEMEYTNGINKAATFSTIERDVFEEFYKQYKLAREDMEE